MAKRKVLYVSDDGVTPTWREQGSVRNATNVCARVYIHWFMLHKDYLFRKTAETVPEDWFSDNKEAEAQAIEVKWTTPRQVTLPPMTVSMCAASGILVSKGACGISRRTDADNGDGAAYVKGGRVLAKLAICVRQGEEKLVRASSINAVAAELGKVAANVTDTIQLKVEIGERVLNYHPLRGTAVAALPGLAASEPGKVQLTALGRQLQKDLLVEYAPVAPPKRRKTMPVAIEMGDAVGGRRGRNINNTPANEGKSNAPQSSNAMDDVSSSSDSSGDSADESPWENAPIMEVFGTASKKRKAKQQRGRGIQG